jgi:methionine-rich copper-binding protein CopC
MMEIAKIKTAVRLFFLLSFIALPGVTHGHAFPDHSDPKVGATISSSPSSVRIWFDGDIEPVFSAISVRDSNGNRVDKGNARVDPPDSTLLEVSVPPLPPGKYRVIWNVVARDGHRTMGDYTFVVK